MRKSSKEVHADQVSMNEYERARYQNILKNRAMMENLGVKDIATLKHSSRSQMTKRKEKTKLIHEKDQEYLPTSDAEVESDAESVSPCTTKRKHQQHFIQPGAIKKKYEFISKTRIIAPDSVDALMLQENRVERNHKDQPCRKTRKVGATSMSMGDLLLKKKLSRVNNVVHNEFAEPTNPTTSILSRRKLSFRDSNEEEVAAQVNEDDDDLDAFLYEQSWNHGVSEGESGDARDNENGDENENAEAESEDDVGAEALHSNEESDCNAKDYAQLETSLQEKKDVNLRGPSMMHNVHIRPFNKRKTIICNEFGQPIGPVTEEEDTVGEFSRFLGTIARDYSYAPLIHKSWHQVPHKDKMWEYVLEKNIVPDLAREWVLKSIASAWRGYKCRVKKKHFYAYSNKKTRWENRPRQVPKEDFWQLLTLWSKDDEKARCSTLRERRKSQKNRHTAGPKIFARFREEMKNEHPNNEAPSLAQLFERTRRRNEDKVYVDTYDDTAKKIEAMKNYESSQDDYGQVDAFLGVMGKEYDGHRRLYGRGVTNKLLKRVKGDGMSHMVSSEFMDSVKASIDAEKSHLIEMRREIEVDHAKKKAELEEMRNSLETEREKLIEIAVAKIVSKLPPGIAQQFLT